MTFSLRELSIFGGRPVELYRFTIGTDRYCFNSSDSDISYSGEVYKSVPIKRNRHILSSEMGKSDISINIARTNPLAQLFIGPPPDDILRLIIYKYHVGDSEFTQLWKGRVTGASVSGSEMTLSCEPLYTSLKRVGLRAKFQVQCPLMVGSALCGVNLEAFKISTTVAAVNGTTVTLASDGGKPNGWLAGGMFVSGGGTKRMILSQTGAILKITHPARALSVGESILAYAGCDHNFATCRDKFSNHLNYGGCPWLPQKNPFAGDAIA